MNLGDQDLDLLTIGQLKCLVEDKSDVERDTIKLWWKGYILDDDSLPISKACVGVNEGEILLDEDYESLVIFMTTVMEDKEEPVDDLSLSSFGQRIRTNSLDIEKVRIEFQKKSGCVIF